MRESLILKRACLISIILVAAVSLAYRIPASSSEQRKAGRAVWKEICSFSPAAGTEPIWCGPNTLIVESADRNSERDNKGIALLDIETREVRWLLRYPYFKDPFPSHDCSKVFYYRFRDDPEEEEGLADEGIWEIDVKTGRQRKVGAVSTDPFRRPASPKEKIYALVPRYEKMPVAQLKIDLPGWKIVRFPKEHQDVGGGLWASDGSYLTLSAAGLGRIFCDNKGRLLKAVKIDFPWRSHHEIAKNAVARPEGLYFFGGDGRLRIVSTKNWAIEEFPMTVVFEKGYPFSFDISPEGEIAYVRGKGLWIGDLTGGIGQRLSDEGWMPAFSKTGLSLAFVRSDGVGNDKIVVVEKTSVQ